jgi:hypothetical protein
MVLRAEEGNRSFVRVLVRSFVHLSSWSKENGNGGKKGNDEGKKEQK